METKKKPPIYPQPNGSANFPVLLFGELLVDCFPDREVPGGAPFNVARHLIGLGAGVGINPILVSRIGEDERGGRLLATVAAAGLAVDGLQQDALHPTGQVRITLDGGSGGHRFEILPDQAWDFIDAESAQLLAGSMESQWLYFGSLAQRGTSRSALAALIEASGAKTFLDINLRDPWVDKEVLRWSLTQAETVKVNAEELCRISGMFGLGRGELSALGERLIVAFALQCLLVTQGGEGAWLLLADGTHIRTNPTGPVVALVDSVGAGDAFAAVFLLGCLLDWPIEQGLQRAHRFAGTICSLRGAVPDSADFYRPFIEEWQLTN